MVSDSDNSKQVNVKSPVFLAVLAAGFIAVAGVLAYIGINQTTPKQSAQASKVAEVTITSTGFVPATLSIAKNTKVIWTNGDTNPHQIQANPHPTGDSLSDLKSEILNNAQTYEYTFTSSGSYTYHDYLNPPVNGVIVVGDK